MVVVGLVEEDVLAIGAVGRVVLEDAICGGQKGGPCEGWVVGVVDG